MILERKLKNALLAKWLKIIFCLVVVFVFWFCLYDQALTVALFFLRNGVNAGLLIVVTHAVSAITALIFLFIYNQFLGVIPIGSIKKSFKKDSILLFLLIVAIYIFFSLVTPKQSYTQLFFAYDKWTNLLRLLTIIFFAPIGEELVLRGFMLEAFISTLGKKWGWIIGSLLVSLFFSYIHHTQYDFMTLVSLFLVSLVFCWGRWKNGIVLSIMLHSFASLVAISI
ncbi:CPBP family intramembrane glutamic endopeptidase [Saezia sanguinis]|uniref:CPBP family intramembrane glutamic endopeptidase n=1 Tax=Saezia sanguinis TaxID=1965230 RepID=UPI0030740D84